METAQHKKEMVWTDFFGNSKPISQLSDQYLCNILWCLESFFGYNRLNSESSFLLGLEWHKRCSEKAGKDLSDGEVKRLSWKPLPIPSEVENLKKFELLNDNGDIIEKLGGSVIGSVDHIEGWKKMIQT